MPMGWKLGGREQPSNAASSVGPNDTCLCFAFACLPQGVACVDPNTYPTLPHPAPLQVEVNTSNSWLVVTVHFEATVRAQYETGGQAGEAEGGGGEGEGVIKTCTMQKRGAWLFSRGPLPRGGSKTLSLPWKVVAWW